jgi:hypothetical protein
MTCYTTNISTLSNITRFFQWPIKFAPRGPTRRHFNTTQFIEYVCKAADLALNYNQPMVTTII